MEYLFEIISKRPRHGIVSDVRTSVCAIRRECIDQAIEQGLSDHSNHGMPLQRMK